MANEWPVLTVGELVNAGVLARPMDGNHGGIHPKGNDFVDEGVPFIMASNLIDGRVDTQNCKFIAKAQADSLRKGVSVSGDVLLSHKATIGRTAIVGDIDTEYIMLTPQVTYYRVIDNGRLNNRYLKYYFDSAPFQSLFAAWAGGGSTRSYLGITGQLKLPVTVPPIEIQDFIANSLGRLDGKISVNRRINEILEGMARTIFKAWFLDYEPVKAKAAGDTSFPGIPQAAFDQLPHTFVDSELGVIPKGWKPIPIGDLVKVVGGGTPSTKKTEFWDGGDHPFCTPKDMSTLRSPILLDTDRHITDAGVNKISSGQLPSGTVLLSSRAPIGYLAIAWNPVSVNQGVIAMQTGDIPNIYILLWTEASMEVIKSRAGGSTFAEISKNNFRPILAMRPDDTTLKVFSDVVNPMFELIAANERESVVLQQARDILLPKLISGEVAVPVINGGGDG
ncbi:MAG: restriction endonuclease subunit S [Planctomycetota bacterium]